MINKWVTEGIHHTVLCCRSLTPPALSLSGLVDERQCPLAIRDQHLTGLPFTHTHSPSCWSVYVCVCLMVCELVCLLSEAQLLSKCHHGEWQPVCVVPVTHTAGLRYCVGTVSSLSVPIAVTSCLCNPHTETLWGFPGPHLLRRICQAVSLSICTTVSPVSAWLWGLCHSSYQLGALLPYSWWCKTNKIDSQFASWVTYCRWGCTIVSCMTSAQSTWVDWPIGYLWDGGGSIRKGSTHPSGVCQGIRMY